MKFTVIVPVYNSAATLNILCDELTSIMEQTQEEFEIIFVDDCSTDGSWRVLKELNSKDNRTRALRLANNTGQWMASLAAISKAKGELLITIDDDLEYETSDILKLIEYYNSGDFYLVYGIPPDKKNKNLSYKLFFTIREKFLRIVLGKGKTESFKIFNRKICLNEADAMRSSLHFEALSKISVSPNYIGHLNVDYKQRKFGKSNHTIWMKIKILMKYGIEYYKSPFRLPLYAMLFLLLLMFTDYYIDLGPAVLLIIRALLALNVLLVIGITGNYLSTMYFVSKGAPEYIIIEEI